MNNQLQVMLDNAVWGEFAIGDLFEISRGTNFPKKDWVEGLIPIITTSGVNNGVSGYLSEGKTLSENSITVAGTGTVGSTFYQPFEHVVGEWVLSIKLKNKTLNKYLAMFLSSTISNQKDKYGYAYKLGNARLKRQKILLPTTQSGRPDWDFMKEFMKLIEHETIPKTYFELHDVEDTRELNQVNWDSFFIEDLFYVQRGKRLIKKNQFKGDIPYVSSTGLSNGVDNMIGNKKNVRFFNNCLTIANSGSIGEVFYHPYLFIASDHVTHIANNELNKYSYQFVGTMLEKIQDKYSFNREISDKRLKREKIMLPINELSKPDWIFMEQYMKRIENELSNKVRLKEDSTLYS